MPLTWEIYVDLLTGDGTPDDDLSAYWRGIDFVQGLRDERQHMADIGRCTVILLNQDKRFSRDYAYGPYYGNLVKGRAVLIKVINDYGTATTQFRGTVQDWIPTAGTKNLPWECRLVVADLLQDLQWGDMSISLMQDFQPDTVVELITNEAFKSDTATGFLEFIGPVDDGDTVAIAEGGGWGPGWAAGTNVGVQTYTLKTALTGAANEVLIETDSDGSDITFENLAAAINYDEGEGTDYGSGTVRNAGFSAISRARVGVDAADRDGWVPLQDTGSAYERLSTSFMVQTDTITTNYVWLYMRKQGSPTGTCTVKFNYNLRGVPNGTQVQTIDGTFAEAATNAAGAWVRVELDDYITFYRYQRYHVELSTDRAAHATNYVEWGEISGTNNYSCYYNGTNWLPINRANVFCIPGRVDIKARWRGSLFNGLVFSSDADDAWWTLKAVAGPNAIAGGTDAPSGLTSFTNDADTIAVIGDQWRTSDRIDAKRALRDVCETGRGYLYCAEDGTITYQPRNWPFERIIATPVLTVTNKQNDTDIQTEKSLYNRVVVTYSERREVEGSVIARAGGSIEIPPNVKQTPQDYSTESGSDGSKQTLGARFNPNDDVERTTITLPFVNDGTGTITGATAVIQPVPGTDFTLTTEANGEGRNATYLAQTRGGGMKVATAIKGAEVQCTFRSVTGITALYVNDLQVRGTALLTLNPQQAIREDETSIAAHGLKELAISLPSITSYGAELAESIANYELNRQKDERTVIKGLYFVGQTMIDSVKLYEIQMGDVVTVTEDQTGIDSERVLVIGRQVREHINRKTPELTLVTRPISDMTYLILDDATYGVLPGNLAI